MSTIDSIALWRSIIEERKLSGLKVSDWLWVMRSAASELVQAAYSTIPPLEARKLPEVF